jgi:hypothetical protein
VKRAVACGAAAKRVSAVAVEAAEPWTLRATLAVLILGGIAVVAVNWPGHLSFDSLVQLNDGRTGRYHTWHPPIMAWMLGVGDRLLRGPGLFMAFDASLLFASLAALAVRRQRVSWAGPIAALVLVLSPLVLIYQGIVWKDVLYANASVAGFVALYLSDTAARTRRTRAVLVALAFAALALAALARQNGAVSVLAGAGAVAAMTLRRAGPAWRKAIVPALGRAVLALVLTAVSVAAVHAALYSRRIDDPGDAAQFQALQQFDLIGGVAHDPAVDLSALKSPALAAWVRRAARAYTPARVDTVAQIPGLSDALTSDDKGVSAAWRAMLRDHPGAYIAHRRDVFGWTLFTPDLSQCVPVFTGVDGPPRLVKALGLIDHQDARDLALEDYASYFYSTPIFSHAAYGLAAVVLLGLLARRRGPGDMAMAAMLTSALAFAACFAIISFACDYRYLYALDLSVMVAAFHLALGRTQPEPPGGAMSLPITAFSFGRTAKSP